MAQHDALLHARWRAAVQARCHCEAAAADSALDDVLARHREAHRAYHGEVHVARVVEAVHDLVAEMSGTNIDVATVVLAAVFHDAVYDPSSIRNEADSADLATRVLTDLGAAPDTVERVHALVLATAAHLDGPGTIDSDTAVLLDADLAVLGAEPAAYQSYVDGVRREYAHVEDADWRRGRRAVVESLLARKPLYLTEPGRARWEARARANLTAERQALGGAES